MHSTWIAWAWIICLAAAGATLAAQSPIGVLIAQQSRTTFTVEGAGARAMGLGGAFIAVADDATAVSFNPAGLAQLLQPEVSLVARGLNRNVGFQDFETTGTGRNLAVSDTLTSSTRFDPLFISATAPIRVAERNLVFQFSLQRAFALGENDERDLQETPLPGGTSLPSQLHQDIRQTGQIDLYSIAMAYEASERILLGLTYNQWRGRWDLASSSVRQAGLAQTTVAFRQANAMDGENFNLGLIWRWPTWSLGLVRRSGFRAEYTFATALETNLPQGGFNASPMNTGLHWPASTGIGFSYRPADRWLLSADLNQTLWSSARYESTSQKFNGLSFFDLDRRNRTPNATDLHLGLEYLNLTTSGLVVPIRCGFSREPQPVVDSLTGVQRIMYHLSVGSGLKRGNLGLDIAYRYGWSDRRASQFLEIDQILSHQQSASLGTERIREHRVDISTIFRFDRRPVERTLRHLFVGD